jgi:hypothetical protein
MFRQLALETIWKSCALQNPIPDADEWECDYQPSTTVAGGGRHDLCLRPPEGAKFAKTLFLESKVGSPLTAHQLKKYRDHGAQVLIAITKNRPELSQQELRQLGVKSMRWQDFCRTLRQAPIAGKAEKFVLHSFADYLEESGMAYPEDLTEQHLHDVGVMFRKIASLKDYEDRSGGLSFNYAHSCLELLRDVRDSLLERPTKLEKWKRWGPGYFKSKEEDEKTYHFLGFSFTGGKWREVDPWFSSRFCFFDDGSVRWTIAHENPKKDQYVEITHKIDSVSSSIKHPQHSVRALDVEKLAKTAEDAARKWHII